MAVVFLLLGSNMGDRLGFLGDAYRKLDNEVGPVLKSSAFYQTAAWGKTDQPDFINQVLKLETDLTPKEVLNTILAIEIQLGRQRAEKWGSRTIDIDILFYDQDVIDEPDLKIPHPNLHERAFTLVPLIEIEPNCFHPVLQKPVLELLTKLNDQLLVQKLNL